MTVFQSTDMYNIIKISYSDDKSLYNIMHGASKLKTN